MADWTHEELRDAMHRVAEHPEASKLALTDPAAAIKQATGRDVPPGIVLDVAERGGGLSYTVDRESALAETEGDDSNCCHIPNALQISCA